MLDEIGLYEPSGPTSVGTQAQFRHFENKALVLAVGANATRLSQVEREPKDHTHDPTKADAH